MFNIDGLLQDALDQASEMQREMYDMLKSQGEVHMEPVTSDFWPLRQKIQEALDMAKSLQRKYGIS